jgi:hypothetical protein
VSVPKTVTTADADMAIALTCFELLAAAKGIGTLWNAMIKWAFSQIDEDLYAALGVPDDHVRGNFMLFGTGGALPPHRAARRLPAQPRPPHLTRPAAGVPFGRRSLPLRAHRRRSTSSRGSTYFRS